MIISGAIWIFKLSARLIYLFLKLLPVQNKVVLMSRRLSKPSIDFKLLDQTIVPRYPDTKVVTLCQPIKNPLIYGFQFIQEMYHLATARACVAESYVIPVSILRHRKSLTVVQMWHALGAIKQFGYQTLDRPEGSSSRVARLMQMHRGYNYVLVGSQAMAEVYAEAFSVDSRKIVPIGLPRVDYLLDEAQMQKNIVAINKRYPDIGERKVILYVPTFRKDSDVKMDELVSRINSQSDKYCLVVKQHLHDKTQIEWGRAIHDKSFDTDAWLARADCVVTDYSAVMFESALAGVPTYFYAYDLEEYKASRGLNVDYETEMPGPICQTVDRLIEAIEQDEYNIDRLHEFADKYVKVRDGSSTDKIINLLNI
ncbi:MAG: CDP-glycerol glycerophosphotransferase family protein [bacterium]|nr:CDP-glycerol glycerophosphotransferase family protein [bacterium]